VRVTRSMLAGVVLSGIAAVTLCGQVACGGGPTGRGPGPSEDVEGPPGPAPARFATAPPGARLPSGARCTAWVRERPLPETKRVNRTANQVVGHHLASSFFDSRSTDPRANRQVASRVDGAFTGTTREILRWAACKWGVDEDLVYAQAAKESWWRQTSMGDWEADPTACAPGHGLGADGRPGMCPQSFGVLQDRYPFQRSAWPGIATSTAMNADTAYALWRSCYEGYDHWLNDVEHGQRYAGGDAWGCVGRWVSGRWHTTASDRYAAAVRAYADQRVWERADFTEM
jgi:hypothetical protein